MNNSDKSLQADKFIKISTLIIGVLLIIAILTIDIGWIKVLLSLVVLLFCVIHEEANKQIKSKVKDESKNN